MGGSLLLLLIAPTLSSASPAPPPAVPHPVARHSPVLWDTGAYPTAVPTRGVPDGPLAGNGDLGVVLGGGVVPGSAIGSPGAGAQGLIPAPGHHNGSLAMYLGKNDFWGWPKAVTYHASFQHFSPGYLQFRLVGVGTAATPIALPAFGGSMSLEDGRLSASAEGSGFRLSLSDTVVLSAQNTVLANLSATCPSGTERVAIELTLSSDTIFAMPLNVSAHDEAGTMRLAKASVANGGLSAPVLVPCEKHQIVYNSLRTFRLAADGGLTVHNDSDAGHPLCFALQPGGAVVTVACAAKPAPWVLQGGELSSTDATGERWCLAAKNVSETGEVTCPGGPQQSYYTDPSADGACQSTAFAVQAVRCASVPQDTAREGGAWSFDAASGFLAASGDASGKCLAAVPPRQTNHLALAAKLRGDNDAAVSFKRAGDVAADGASVVSRRVEVSCGASLQLTIGVATERDAAAADAASPAAMAEQLATLSSASVPALLSQHEAWWADWWGVGSVVDLGEWSAIERNYYTMAYLMRGSMREGRVAPGLWGHASHRIPCPSDRPVPF